MLGEKSGDEIRATATAAIGNDEGEVVENGGDDEGGWWREGRGLNRSYISFPAINGDKPVNASCVDLLSCPVTRNSRRSIAWLHKKFQYRLRCSNSYHTPVFMSVGTHQVSLGDPSLIDKVCFNQNGCVICDLIIYLGLSFNG